MATKFAAVSPAELASLLVSLCSLGVALWAIHVSRVTMQRSDRNASAAMHAGLNGAFTEAWRNFRSAQSEDDAEFEFSELANLLEVACAAHCDGAVQGVARELLEDYLCSTLTLIGDHPVARDRILAAREKPTTFRYVVRFLRAMNRCGKAKEIEGLFEPRPI